MSQEERELIANIRCDLHERGMMPIEMRNRLGKLADALEARLDAEVGEGEIEEVINKGEWAATYLDTPQMDAFNDLVALIRQLLRERDEARRALGVSAKMCAALSEHLDEVEARVQELENAGRKACELLTSWDQSDDITPVADANVIIMNSLLRVKP